MTNPNSHHAVRSAIPAILLAVTAAVYGQAGSQTLTAASDALISSYDSQHISAAAKGLTATINTDPKFSESGGSLKLEPLAGFDLGTMQYNWRSPAGTFSSDGIKFWAKATSQKVVLKVILSILRPEPLGTATYSANVVVSNQGSTIVVPFSDFVHESGAKVDFPAEVSQYMTYCFFKFYKTPISTLYIDSLQNMESGDVKTETVLGPPDVEVADPDLAFTPGEESPNQPPMLYNFSKLPEGFGVKGLKVDAAGSPPLIANPAKVDAGTSVKLEPMLGSNLSDTQFNFRMPAGSIKGSGIRFWARSDVEGTVLDFIMNADGTYATQIALSTEGKFYEVPFKDLQHRSGGFTNIGKSVREKMTYVFFKFFKAPISTIYIDSIQDIPFDAEKEASDPTNTTVATTEPQPMQPAAPSEKVEDPADSAPINDPNWKLTWSDEFNGPKIDTAAWNWAPAQNRNSEIGYFTDRPENSGIEDGKLVITSLKENYKNLAEYTSAELTTKGKVGFLYGKLEISAKLPGGKGAWPAFWLLGESGGWPACGEIDIMEMIGGKNDGATKGENVTNGSLHWSDANNRHRSYGEHYNLPEGKFTESYHKIGILWSKNKIRWYIDDHIFREADISPAEMSEFHQKMYVLLNTSIGGGWPGNPDETTVFPMKYCIDYVRYYTYADPDKDDKEQKPNNPQE
ncbi:MAG: glycoside hydrolase family 16 protein [Terrimicrobiaceae bacterium]